MKWIYITLFILINMPATAQNKKWTLNQCMLYAVDNSPKIKKDKAYNKIYHQNYIEAIGSLLPQISGIADAYFSFGRGLDSETNTYTNINSFSNSYNINGSVVLLGQCKKLRGINS